MFAMVSRRVRATAVLSNLTLVAGFLAQAVPAAAAEMPVPCSTAALITAIELANDEVAYPGGDTLVLQAGCTYSFAAEYAFDDALPRITSGITVVGNGAIIERADGAESFGVSDVSGDLILSNLTLREFWGFNGAYFFVNGSLVLIDSVITNVAPFGQQDPAIEVHSVGTLAIIDSLIENQTDVDSGAGAAINNSGYLAVIGSTFRNNAILNIAGGPAVQVGGAIANSGTAQIFDSTFSGNRAGAVGGAIRNSGALEVYRSTFTGGAANFGAAIANGAAADLLVVDSYFEDNRANLDGGAIYNGGESLATVRNSTFYRNRALFRDGGAIHNAHGMRIEYSTFAENTAAEDGDTLAGSAGLIVVEGSIISGNAGSSHCAGSVSDFDYNVVHPALGTCPGTFTVGNPLLTPPALRGGSTKTMALGAGSAAYNAASATDCPVADQRGKPRPVGGFCDAGALEDQPPTTPGAPALAAPSVTPNQGQFGLAWTPATDPDGTPVSYQLYHRAANAVKFGLVGTTNGPSYSFGLTPEDQGTFRYALYALDGNNFSQFSAVSAPVVVDRTGPSAPAASTDRAPDYVAGLEWFADTVTVSFAGSVDPPLPDGSPGSGVSQITAPQTFTTSGEHTATGKATDYAGNDSPDSSLTVHVDADAPDIAFTNCPADVLLYSNVQAAWAASDPHSGLSTPASGSIPLDTSSIATRNVVAEAADNVGHDASATCVYRVIYDFSGFFKPVANPPTLNAFRAGDVVPLPFGPHVHRNPAASWPASGWRNRPCPGWRNGSSRPGSSPASAPPG
jgi:hypothetical protein